MGSSLLVSAARHPRRRVASGQLSWSKFCTSGALRCLSDLSRSWVPPGSESGTHSGRHPFCVLSRQGPNCLFDRSSREADMRLPIILTTMILTGFSFKYNPDVSDLPQEKTTGKLELVASFSGPMPTGVTVSEKGRIFVNFPQWGDPVDFTVA